MKQYKHFSNGFCFEILKLLSLATLSLSFKKEISFHAKKLAFYFPIRLSKFFNKRILSNNILKIYVSHNSTRASHNSPISKTKILVDFEIYVILNEFAEKIKCFLSIKRINFYRNSYEELV